MAIRFETNVPIEMAFTYPTGKETEGRYGVQFYRGTTDGESVYLAPIVEQRLIDMNVQPGERVAICKRESKDGRKRGIIWEVKRVDAPGAPYQANGNGPSKNAPPATNQAPYQGPQQTEANTPTVHHTQVSSCLKSCLCAAIDAVRDAQIYAQNSGFPMKFSEGEVQALAVTLYIQSCKESNINLMNRNSQLRSNGGGQWRQ